MAAKIVVVALAVIAALGAAEANTGELLIGIAERAVKEIDNQIRRVDDLFNASVVKALDLVDSQLNNLDKAWNKQIDAASAAAVNAGFNVAGCLDLQKNLPDVLDTARIASRECVETSAYGVHKAVLELTSLNTKANDVLAKARTSAAACEEKNFLSAALCLGKIAGELKDEVVSVSTEVVAKASEVIKDISLIAPTVSQCSAAPINDAVAAAQEVLGSTKKCIQDLVNN